MKAVRAYGTIRAAFLQGDPGFVVSDDRGYLLGHVAFNITETGEFYGHSLMSRGDPAVAATLVQALRQECKRRGHKSLIYHVQAPALAMLRLVDKGHASIESAILRMEV